MCSVVAVVGTNICGPNCGNIATGALAGFFTAGIGAGFDGLGAFFTNGFIGGFASRIQGGSFGHGFIAAGAGSAAGGVGSGGARIITSALIGGTVSRITGGKFANGAVSSAFATAVTAGFNGDFNKSSGKFKFFGTGEKAILNKDPNNHCDIIELFDGKVQLAKWGSSDATVSDSESQIVEADLEAIFGTKIGKAMSNTLSVEEPLKILLNDHGSNGGCLGKT